MTHLWVRVPRQGVGGVTDRIFMEKEGEYFIFLSNIQVLIKMHPGAVEALRGQSSPRTSRGWALPVSCVTHGPSLAHFYELAWMPLVPEVAHQTPCTSLVSPAQTFGELHHKHLHGDVLQNNVLGGVWWRGGGIS